MILALLAALLFILAFAILAFGFPFRLPFATPLFYDITGQGGPDGQGGAVTASPVPSGMTSSSGGPGGTSSPGQAGSTPSLTPTGNEIPVISERTFVDGSATVDVSGAFSLHATIALSDLAFDIADGVETSLSYGANRDSGGISLGFSHREGADGLGLNINLGPWTATYLGDGCTWQVSVTDTTVAGHISCVGISAVNSAVGTTGSVKIELDFTANS